MSELIHTIGIHHLCIRHNDIELIANTLELSDTEKLIFDKEHNWSSLYKDATEFLIIESNTEWTYVVFNIWEFDLIKLITQKLSENLKTEVNYFFIDPWVSTTRWINCENGKVNRSHWQEDETVFENYGSLPLEHELINKPVSSTIKEINEIDILWNDTAKLYWNLSNTLSPSISSLNEGKTYKVIRGRFDKSKVDTNK